MKTPKYAFGRRLRRLRQHANLSQADLADRSGLQVMTIGRLETGLVHDVRLSTLDALARGLGRKTYELLLPDAGDQPADLLSDELVRDLQRLRRR